MEAASQQSAASHDVTSQPFESHWQTLVSTTNWEKGRIIARWRAAMIEADAPAAEYSDDAWSRRVGGVTGQHVGRLRRVWDRFGATFESYQSLFWSHFQAALDWNDPELWLEGAVQNGWSVSAMRHQRWEATGASAELKPRPEDIVAAELDEDFLGEAESAQRLVEAGGARNSADEETEAAPWEGGADQAALAADGTEAGEADSVATAAAVRPFEHLGELPDDLADAFESFKLSILRHKRSGWAEIDCDSVLQTLDALKALAVAPTGEE